MTDSPTSTVKLHIDDASYDTACLSHLIDHVHSVFDAPERPQGVGMLSADHWLISKLLVHEWVANLVQHAQFGDRNPEIVINFESAGNGSTVRYVIEDNSMGFDLATYLEGQTSVREPLPERGMGLLILSTCSEEIVYRRVNEGKNRLEFVLRSKPITVDLGLDRLAA